MSNAAPDLSQEPTGQSPGAEPQGRIARLVVPARRLLAWIKASRFRKAMAAGIGLAALGAVVTVWLALSTHEPVAPPITLDMAFEALDRGDYAAAKQLAKALAMRGVPDGEPPGGAAYVLGVVAAHEAGRASGPQAKQLSLVAAGHLREAGAGGLPRDRAAQAMLVLGKSLFLAGQASASHRPLQEALKLDPRPSPEVLWFLASACLHDPAPKLPEALRYNAKYLADPGLTDSQRRSGLLQRAEILLRSGQTAECEKTLDRLPAPSQQDPETLVLRAQIEMHRAQAPLTDPTAADGQVRARERYQAAMQLLRGVQKRESANTSIGRRAIYLTGVCLLETGEKHEALRQFYRARATGADSPEVLAANLYEAELTGQLGQDEESLAAYARALRSVVDAENYNNPYVPLAQLRRRTLEAYRQHLDARQYRWCVTLVQYLAPAFPEDQAMELSADTYRSWARELTAQSERLAPSRAAAWAKAARALLREAGAAHERIAKLHLSKRSHVDDLWESASDYLEGQDYPAAVRLLQEYLKQEVRRRNAQAWTSLGEAKLAMGRVDEALAALDQCIGFYARDAASFRARLLASQACVEKGDLSRARRLLEENLEGELLTPASKEWRDSLFALGELLYRSKRYEEAVRRLDEAVRRYPDSRRAPEARYWIADAHREIARAEAARLPQDVTEATRAARSKRIHDSLQAALEGFRRTQELLLRAQETAELQPVEQALLRNCYFAVASVLFELGEYEAAIQANTLIASRCQGTPEVLEAYVQIARAYRQLGKPAEARLALKQGETALARMKPQVAFHETTNRGRREWEEALKQ